MAPPTWLPPLNSNHQQKFHVKVSPEKPLYYPVLEDPYFWLMTSITLMFESDKSTNQRILQGLSCTRESLPIPCWVVLESPSLSLSLMRIVLDEIFIPFDLTTKDMNDLAETILSVARSRLQRTCTESHNLLPLTLELTKEVRVPDDEFEAWISWYDEKRRVDPDFERDYKEAISRDRTDEELWYEEACLLSQTTGAAKSCIEELEEVKAVDCSSSNASFCCLICLEEMALGSKVTRLPCSHMFHGNCILKWLRGSHTCPLCGFALPTAEA